MLGPGVFSPCVITRINQIVFLKKKKTKINKNSIIILTLKNDWFDTRIWNDKKYIESTKSLSAVFVVMNGVLTIVQIKIHKIMIVNSLDNMKMSLNFLLV